MNTLTPAGAAADGFPHFTAGFSCGFPLSADLSHCGKPVGTSWKPITHLLNSSPALSEELQDPRGSLHLKQAITSHCEGLGLWRSTRAGQTLRYSMGAPLLTPICYTASSKCSRKWEFQEWGIILYFFFQKNSLMSLGIMPQLSASQFIITNWERPRLWTPMIHRFCYSSTPRTNGFQTTPSTGEEVSAYPIHLLVLGPCPAWAGYESNDSATTLKMGHMVEIPL